jgi:hypothetical protein
MKAQQEAMVLGEQDPIAVAAKSSRDAVVSA